MKSKHIMTLLVMLIISASLTVPAYADSRTFHLQLHVDNWRVEDQEELPDAASVVDETELSMIEDELNDEPDDGEVETDTDDAETPEPKIEDEIVEIIDEDESLPVENEGTASSVEKEEAISSPSEELMLMEEDGVEQVEQEEQTTDGSIEIEEIIEGDKHNENTMEPEE